jgi:hypothetical protein
LLTFLRVFFSSSTMITIVASRNGGPPAIDPYQDYINYLHDNIMYNLKRRLDEALASPDRPANNQCALVRLALVNATQR